MSKAKIFNIKVDEKTDTKMVVTTSLPLSGFNAYISIKKSIDDNTYVYNSTGDVDVVNNLITIIIPHTALTEMGVYFYDITVDDGNSRYTLVKGQIDVDWVVKD